MIYSASSRFLILCLLTLFTAIPKAHTADNPIKTTKSFPITVKIEGKGWQKGNFVRSRKLIGIATCFSLLVSAGLLPDEVYTFSPTPLALAKSAAVGVFASLIVFSHGLPKRYFFTGSNQKKWLAPFTGKMLPTSAPFKTLSRLVTEHGFKDPQGIKVTLDRVYMQGNKDSSERPFFSNDPFIVFAAKGGSSRFPKTTWYKITSKGNIEEIVWPNEINAEPTMQKLLSRSHDIKTLHSKVIDTEINIMDPQKRKEAINALLFWYDVEALLSEYYEQDVTKKDGTDIASKLVSVAHEWEKKHQPKMSFYPYVANDLTHSMLSGYTDEMELNGWKEAAAILKQGRLDSIRRHPFLGEKSNLGDLATIVLHDINESGLEEVQKALSAALAHFPLNIETKKLDSAKAERLINLLYNNSSTLVLLQNVFTAVNALPQPYTEKDEEIIPWIKALHSLDHTRSELALQLASCIYTWLENAALEKTQVGLAAKYLLDELNAN